MDCFVALASLRAPRNDRKITQDSAISHESQNLIKNAQNSHKSISHSTFHINLPKFSHFCYNRRI
ncbi:hypothetical protein ACWIUD_11510 [Helicobacter sp. 23-1044]